MASVVEYTFNDPGVGVPTIEPVEVPLKFIVSDPELSLLPENNLLRKGVYIPCRRIMVKSSREQYYTEYIRGTVLCTISDISDVHVLSDFIHELSDSIDPHEICSIGTNHTIGESKIELSNGLLIGTPDNLSVGIGDMRSKMSNSFWKESKSKDALLTGTFKFKLMPVGLDGTVTSDSDTMTAIMKHKCWVLVVEMVSGAATLLEHSL